MRNLIVKIKKAIDLIEKEKGAFDVKCLVAKNPDEVCWDLILSADWFSDSKMKDMEYLSPKILSDFDIDDMLQFSSIVIFKKNNENPLLKELKKIQAHEKGNHGLESDYMVETLLEQARLVIPIKNACSGSCSGVPFASEKTVATV